jgi:hypothetical protein
MRFEQDFLEDYSDEGLLQELKRVAELHPTWPLTKALFLASSRCSHSTIQRRFGSWKEALNRAGLGDRYKGPPKPKAAPSEQICAVRRVPAGSRRNHFIALLQKVAMTIGKDSISLFEFDESQTGVSSSTIRKEFGSWSRALSAAGLCTQRTWLNPVTSQECFSNLSALWKALGRQPTYSDLKAPYLGPKAYERIWGNFSKALAAFREAPEGKECLRLYPTESMGTRTRVLEEHDLIEELRRVGGIVGKSEVAKADVLNHSRIDPRTFELRFGSWKNAIDKAGLGIAGTARRYSDEELFANLMETWEALGHRPSYADMSLPASRNPAATYANRFGSWRKAVLAFLQWAEDDQSEGADASLVAQPPIDKDISIAPSPAVVVPETLVLPNGQRDPRRTATNKQKFRIRKRDGYRCSICGHSQSDGCRLVIDHIHAWSMGGRTIDANLWTLCDICNSGKGADAL